MSSSAAMIWALGVKASEPDKPTLYLWQSAATTRHVNDLQEQRV